MDGAEPWQSVSVRRCVYDIGLHKNEEGRFMLLRLLLLCSQTDLRPSAKPKVLNLFNFITVNFIVKGCHQELP
jgi:hypothetical protein